MYIKTILSIYSQLFLSSSRHGVYLEPPVPKSSPTNLTGDALRSKEREAELKKKQDEGFAKFSFKPEIGPPATKVCAPLLAFLTTATTVRRVPSRQLPITLKVKVSHHSREVLRSFPRLRSPISVFVIFFLRKGQNPLPPPAMLFILGIRVPQFSTLPPSPNSGHPSSPPVQVRHWVGCVGCSDHPSLECIFSPTAP